MSADKKYDVGNTDAMIVNFWGTDEQLLNSLSIMASKEKRKMQRGILEAVIDLIIHKTEESNILCTEKHGDAEAIAALQLDVERLRTVLKGIGFSTLSLSDVADAENRRQARAAVDGGAA